MARPIENSKRTYVFLSPEDFEVLKSQSEREGSSISVILRRLAKEYIAKLSELNQK